MTQPELKNFILEKFNEGSIVLASAEGLSIAPLDEFLKQPSDGILYDLNRLESVVLTFMGDAKWINDFAVAKVIRTLKDRISELEKEALNNKSQQ